MNYIGIDLHKFIWTMVVIDDNEKVVEQIVDAETSVKGLEHIVQNYAADDCVIAFENLTRAHFADNFFKKHGYRTIVLHTGHGCVAEISKSNYKCDLEDARKISIICKDIATGRREYRLAHLTDQQNMIVKSLLKTWDDCSVEYEKNNLRIQEYMNMNDLHLPEGYKSFTAKRSLRFMKTLDHPALTIMCELQECLTKQIDYAESTLEKMYADDEDMRLLTEIKGIGLETAAVILTTIDGIHRFDSPEKLVSFFGLGLRRCESGGVERGRHITKEGNPRVRKLLANVIKNHARCYRNSDLTRFYERMKEKKDHWDAVTAAMCKLTRIIWAVLYKGEPYRLNMAEKA